MAKKEDITRKKKTLVKLRFYDTNFKIIGGSWLIAFISMFILGSIGEGISLIFIMISVAPLLIIKWGMFYHQFKSKRWGWLLSSILLTLISLGFIILTVFYFKVMRKEFKKGNGIYN